MSKGLQHYFGVSEERGEEIIYQVTSCFFLNLKDEEMRDVNMLKYVTAQNVKDILLVTSPNELILIGILIEQAYNATHEKPRIGIFGNLK